MHSYIHSTFVYSNSSSALYGARNPLHTHSFLAVTCSLALDLQKTAQAKQQAMAAVSRTPPTKPPQQHPQPSQHERRNWDMLLKAMHRGTACSHTHLIILFAVCRHGAATNYLFHLVMV